MNNYIDFEVMQLRQWRTKKEAACRIKNHLCWKSKSKQDTAFWLTSVCACVGPDCTSWCQVVLRAALSSKSNLSPMLARRSTHNNMRLSESHNNISCHVFIWTATMHPLSRPSRPVIHISQCTCCQVSLVWALRLLSNPVTHLTYMALVAVLGINFYPTPLSAGN